jgi:phage host-nuclease inhibitor protein Gam
MRNYIYETLDYTQSESEIKSQIESKYNEIMSLCTGVLEYFNVDKVEVDLNRRSVSIHLVFGFNKFRLDPIYLSIEINL